MVKHYQVCMEHNTPEESEAYQLLLKLLGKHTGIRNEKHTRQEIIYQYLKCGLKGTLNNNKTCRSKNASHIIG